MESQLSLFDTDNHSNSTVLSNTLKIVKADFVKEEKVSWEELFDGFDEMYAITFSSGIQFTNRLLDKFSYAEIIFGCEEIVDSNIAAIMALQISQIETLVNSKSAINMAEKMKNEALKLYVSRDTKSHEKLFVLKSNEGKMRVITGSANMSASAFCGVQRENIVYFDGEEAFDYYKNRFEDFREKCSDNVNQKVLERMVAGEEDLLRNDPEEIPIAQTIKTKKMVLIEEYSDIDEEEISIVADVKGLEAELKPMLPKPQKDGKILITSEQLHPFKRKYQEQRQIQVAREKQLPNYSS